MLIYFLHFFMREYQSKVTEQINNKFPFKRKEKIPIPLPFIISRNEHEKISSLLYA